MPDIKTVEEVLEMDIGMPVPLVKGIIDKIFDRNTGKSKFGKYSFENFYLSDVRDEDSRIKVTLKNCPKMEFEEGDTIIIAANESGKGWSGCETDESEYKGNVETILMVTDAAEIMDAADFDDRGDDPPPKKRRSRESSRKPARKSSRRRDDDDEDDPPPKKRRSSEGRSRRSEYVPEEGEDSGGEEAFIKRLFQAANCYLRAYGMMQAVNQAAVSAQLPAMLPEQIQAGTYTLFAQSIKRDTLASMPGDEITVPEIDDLPNPEEEGEESRPKSRKRTSSRTKRSRSDEGNSEERYPGDSED